MAKQIYIDENGNEQLVSGTINTADMLPIESGSATNTKDYIDNSVPKYHTTASTKLNTLSWTQSASGVYYALIDLSGTLTTATRILSVSICGFSAIRSTDIITPFINANDIKIGIMANSNSFASPDTALTFRVIYI